MSKPAADSGIPVVESLAADLKDQPDYCLRPHQRLEYEEEAVRLRSVAEAPDWQSGAAKVAAAQRYRKVLGVLRDQAPKPVEEPLRRDRIAKQADEVLKDVIVPAMLSKAEMRRNPAGAVGEFMRRENSMPIQRAIRTWQRAKYALEPDTTNDDHALVEKYRPEFPAGYRPDGVATFMSDAQIPGHFGFSPQAKQNWPLPEPDNTALKQALKAEVLAEARQELAEAIAAEKAEPAPKVKRKATPAQLAVLAAGRAKMHAGNTMAAPFPAQHPSLELDHIG